MLFEGVNLFKRLPATLAFVGSVIAMKLLVALAVMNPGKPFPAARPLALKRFLLVM